MNNYNKKKEHFFRSAFDQSGLRILDEVGMSQANASPFVQLLKTYLKYYKMQQSIKKKQAELLLEIKKK